MKLLGHLVKANSKMFSHNKMGSIFIEASLVMPMACIVSIMMLQIAICFFYQFQEQVETHMEALNNKNYMLQIEIIRNNEKFM